MAVFQGELSRGPDFVKGRGNRPARPVDSFSSPSIPTRPLPQMLRPGAPLTLLEQGLVPLVYVVARVVLVPALSLTRHLFARKGNNYGGLSADTVRL